MFHHYSRGETKSLQLTVRRNFVLKDHLTQFEADFTTFKKDGCILQIQNWKGTINALQITRNALQNNGLIRTLVKELLYAERI